MQNWKIILAYDGTSFHGWQVQPGLLTVQGTLAAALKRITGEAVLPQGSGRTDAGVHALGQVASFELAAPIPPDNLLRALNRSLPPSIRVSEVQHARALGPRPFHARHSAVGKTYEYRIFLRTDGADGTVRAGPDRVCSPFLAPYVWDCPWPVCFSAMQRAATAILGEHDFTSFAASDPDLLARRDPEPQSIDTSSVRTISRSEWLPADGLLVYRVTGSGFLHHMVRNLVGTFVEAGAGRIDSQSIPAILAARDRAAAGPTAPARGLFLLQVEYPHSDVDPS